MLPFFASAICLLPSCKPANDSQSDSGTNASVSLAVTAIGDTVADFGSSAMVIHRTANGDLWVGGDGPGLYRQSNGKIVQYGIKDGLCDLRIREIQEDKAGHLFFGTVKGISMFDGQSFTTLPVQFPTSGDEQWKSSPDDLWFKSGSEKTGPYRWDGKSLHDLRFPKHYMEDEFRASTGTQTWSPYEIYDIYEDANGHVWFGTGNLGLCRWDGTHLEWLYEDDLQFTPRGGSFGIRCIMQEGEGRYWICNTKYRYEIEPSGAAGEVPMRDGCRLLRYRRTPVTPALKAPNGDDHIYFMSGVEEYLGKQWFVTYDQGIWSFDGKTWTHFPIQDGGKAFTAYSMTRTWNGELWVGTHEGGPFRWEGNGFRRYRP